jgi:hypothetical protein
VSHRIVLLSTVSPAALFAAMLELEPVGWYGAIDTGYHYVGDL